MSYWCFWYEKVASLITYIDTHQKSSFRSEIYVGVDNICSNKQWRKSKEEFYLEILSWGQDGGNKNKTPLWFYFLNLRYLPMTALKQKNTLDKFMANTEAYSEPSQIHTMKLFWENR